MTKAYPKQGSAGSFLATVSDVKNYKTWIVALVLFFLVISFSSSGSSPPAAASPSSSVSAKIATRYKRPSSYHFHSSTEKSQLREKVRCPPSLPFTHRASHNNDDNTTTTNGVTAPAASSLVSSPSVALSHSCAHHLRRLMLRIVASTLIVVLHHIDSTTCKQQHRLDNIHLIPSTQRHCRLNALDRHSV